jgi:hypothetical protein
MNNFSFAEGNFQRAMQLRTFRVKPPSSQGPQRLQVDSDHVSTTFGKHHLLRPAILSWGHRQGQGRSFQPLSGTELLISVQIALVSRVVSK